MDGAIYRTNCQYACDFKRRRLARSGLWRRWNRKVRDVRSSRSNKTPDVHSVSEPGYSLAHGLGVGDIKGDGRMDIVNVYGW